LIINNSFGYKEKINMKFSLKKSKKMVSYLLEKSFDQKIKGVLWIPLGPIPQNNVTAFPGAFGTILTKNCTVLKNRCSKNGSVLLTDHTSSSYILNKSNNWVYNLDGELCRKDTEYPTKEEKLKNNLKSFKSSKYNGVLYGYFGDMLFTKPPIHNLVRSNVNTRDFLFYKYKEFKVNANYNSIMMNFLDNPYFLETNDISFDLVSSNYFQFSTKNYLFCVSITPISFSESIKHIYLFTNKETEPEGIFKLYNRFSNENKIVSELTQTNLKNCMFINDRQLIRTDSISSDCVNFS
jgi:hypothetical protein